MLRKSYLWFLHCLLESVFIKKTNSEENTIDSDLEEAVQILIRNTMFVDLTYLLYTVQCTVYTHLHIYYMYRNICIWAQLSNDVTLAN